MSRHGSAGGGDEGRGGVGGGVGGVGGGVGVGGGGGIFSSDEEENGGEVDAMDDDGGPGSWTGAKDPARNTWRPASVRAMETPSRAVTMPSPVSRAMGKTAAATSRERALTVTRSQKDLRRREHERSISPRGERPSKPSVVPHMWDVIHFVSRSYSDVYRQL